MQMLPVIPPRDVRWYGTPQEHGARCDICPLKGNTFVPYSAPAGKPLLVLVGEGPGRREEMERTPFVGITGRQLNTVLHDVGLARERAWVTNAALCASDDDRENARAAECCSPRLLKELSKIPADVPIVPLGKSAVQSVLGVKSVLLARGFVWTARDLEDPVKAALANVEKLKRDRRTKPEKGRDAVLRLQTLKQRHKLAGRTVLPTLHPTFAFIHNELWAPIFELDMNRVGRWIRGELTAAMLVDNIERVDSLRELRKRERTFIVTDSVKDLAAASKILGNEIGCDIETERIKPLSPMLAPILCVQLSDGKRSVVIAPWDPKRHAPALAAFLKGRVVVFHNGYCFDQIALTCRDGVSFEGVQLEDTLTAHHTFASCFPQKLDHVVATFLDCSPWKIRHGVRGAEEKGLSPNKGDADDLFLYGATDAVVTILAWHAMQADLEPERAVYEHDKRRSLLYRQMQVMGYPVDRRRQRLLSKKLKRRAAALSGHLKKLARRKEFKPSKLTDVRRALFHTLKAPLLNPTPTGLASTSNATLEALREGAGSRVARFSEAMLNWRFTVKAKSTYVDTVPAHRDHRAHYNFKPFGVITGRPASRILSAPRWSKALPERFREIFCASKDRALVYFDLAQAEARFAANLAADKNFIEACAKDIHTKNALLLFPDAREVLERDPKGKHCPRHSEGGSASAACNCGKTFRDVTKNAGFAIIYQAAPAKVFAFLRSQGFPVQMDHVEAMFDAMRGAYFEHDRWVKDMLRFATEHGYLRTALVGRMMRVGFHPKPTDVSNLPIQSGIADVMDTRLLDQIVPRLPADVKMIMHHYDSATFDASVGDVDAVQKIIEEVWKEPVRLPRSIVCREDCEFMLPAEVKVGKRWSDF